MALIEKVHSSLEELQELVKQTTDPLEREGLIAFINCITPHLETASATFLGKIAQVIGADISTAGSVEEVLEALKENFEIEIE
ncbi:hypothetical protein [Geobacillus sp. C56-T3]|uniref:hypothetical protein n=1 Tax=Geobacillus sp. (strain C56-T3) TaxID=691437 RepID=UPI0001D584CC|nr:hypothetical protein [Geobacillus sp. C56-T3]ADI28002.1 signal-transducing histidine kinase [Geobacillus sp. C56-T3]